jgi:hypothetical protein
MTNNEHIRDFLIYYCKLPTEPQYAVLLTGLWGSGKTWFIKDFLAKHEPKQKSPLYLSLYGMQSLDDIDSGLFQLLHPVLGSKPARILGRVARGVLKATINIDLNGDDISDGSMNVGIPNDKLLDRISLKANSILVLDDLERCSIPIADLLGYINQFIEHGGIKAILIANEHELLNSKTENNVDYSKIKEKLIGRTFEVVPEVASALNAFANDLPDGKAKGVVSANLLLITQVYECSNYKNLRHVRHALWEFDRLTNTIDPTALNKALLLADLLALFLSYYIEVHSGNIKATEVKQFLDEWTPALNPSNNESDTDRRFQDIHTKYTGLNLYKSLIPDHVWETIFTTGSIPQTELNESLLNSKYFQNENQPNWVRLWYGVNLTDKEFENVLILVEGEWNNRHYHKLGEVIHVTGLFIRFANSGIYKKTVDEIVQSAKEYIDYLFINGDIPVQQLNSHMASFEKEGYSGLSFTSENDDNFKEFLKYIEQRQVKALESSYPEQAAKLLELVGTDTDLFYRRIILSNHQDNFYYETPILHLISPNVFVNRMLSASPENWKTVVYALKQRYRTRLINLELQDELDWLKEISKLLQNEVENRTGKISSFTIKSLIIPYINDAINQLKQSMQTRPTISTAQRPGEVKTTEQ